MQDQIKNLTTLVVELIPSVMYDEERKNAIMAKLNEIQKPIPSQEQPRIEKQNSANNEIKKSQENKDVGKRKEKSSRITPHYELDNDDKSRGRVSFLIQWYNEEGISRTSPKRFKRNNE